MVPQTSSNDLAVQGAIPPQGPSTLADQQLEDWNAFYQLLLAGKLNSHAGEFIVIHRGKVMAHGTDPDELRRQSAQQLAVAADALVIPFVDNKECVVVN